MTRVATTFAVARVLSAHLPAFSLILHKPRLYIVFYRCNQFEKLDQCVALVTSMVEKFKQCTPVSADSMLLPENSAKVRSMSAKARSSQSSALLTDFIVMITCLCRRGVTWSQTSPELGFANIFQKLPICKLAARASFRTFRFLHWWQARKCWPYSCALQS